MYIFFSSLCVLYLRFQSLKVRRLSFCNKVWMLSLMLGENHSKISALALCTDHVTDNQGVNCDGKCYPIALWCNHMFEEYCADSGLHTSDPGLCSNTTFWQDKSCNLTYAGKLYPGERCTGVFQHCYYPKGSPDVVYFPTTCKDK